MSEEMYPQELIDEYYNAIQELHEALNDKDQQITDLQYEKEVIQKALELACKEELREFGVYDEDYGSEQKLFQLIEDYKQQAKEMENGER